MSPAALTTLDPRIAALAEGARRGFLEEHPGVGAPVVVVIAALDEAGAVGEVVRTVPRRLCGLDVEVLVVDDGSTDGTAAEAARAGALVARLSRNTGQGSALALGYRLACERGASYVATTDADGQLDSAELAGLIEILVRGEADLVSGSRRLGDAHATGALRPRGLVVFAGIISILTGVRITDPACGLRAMRSEVAAGLDLLQPQYQSSELLIRAIANGFRVAEVPVTVSDRSDGSSNKGGNLAYSWRFGRALLSTWWSSRATARRNSKRL